MSDIPTPVVSLNDPISDIRLAALLGLGRCEQDASGYYCDQHDSRVLHTSGLCVRLVDDLDIAERAMNLVLPILTDLIAELRDEAPSYNSFAKMLLLNALDRAEARLKGLNDE
jgi:hypothetical protein